MIPIGSAHTLTLLSTWNRNFYYQSDSQKGATCGTGGTALAAGTQLTADNCTAASQIGTYGLNYGLGSDPTKQDYWKYNRTDKTTDFSYIRLQSKLARACRWTTAPICMAIPTTRFRARPARW
ncbi:hypothetical protein [Novosphingobium rhizosphaerae]|uniref:hypothetical protein n=1 Tax=Novosphingobium rhizosphaerae TaxID=1551649 RepID=UPI003D81B86D